MRSIAKGAVALVSGVVFGAGLALSGMTDPRKIIGFLDPFGGWDASLAFAMIGGVAVHLIAYRWIVRRRAPLFASSFAIPWRREIDLRLIVGSVVFGVGWGIGGYCPGPAVTSLASGALGVVLFVLGMMLGMLAVARLEAFLGRKSSRPTTAEAANRADVLPESTS